MRVKEESGCRQARIRDINRKGLAFEIYAYIFHKIQLKNNSKLNKIKVLILCMCIDSYVQLVF